MDDGHPELSAVNFFTGKMMKRIVTGSEYENFPIPFPATQKGVPPQTTASGSGSGQGSSSTGDELVYGVLARGQVLNGDQPMGELVLRHRAQLQLQLPRPGAAARVDYRTLSQKNPNMRLTGVRARACG